MLDAARALWAILSKMGWFQVLLTNWMLLLPLGFIVSLLGMLVNYADDIHTNIQAIVAYLPSASWAGLYSKINRVIPLTESLGMMGLLFSVKMAALLVRWVKVLIPNVVTGS